MDIFAAYYTVSVRSCVGNAHDPPRRLVWVEPCVDYSSALVESSPKMIPDLIPDDGLRACVRAWLGACVRALSEAKNGRKAEFKGVTQLQQWQMRRTLVLH